MHRMALEPMVIMMRIVAGHDMTFASIAQLRAFEMIGVEGGGRQMLAITLGKAPTPSNSNVTISRTDSRFETLLMIGVLFVFSMCATYFSITMTGPARWPAGLAAMIAPLVSHRVLARQH
jgi:hypothetical protein